MPWLTFIFYRSSYKSVMVVRAGSDENISVDGDLLCNRSKFFARRRLLGGIAEIPGVSLHRFKIYLEQVYQGSVDLREFLPVECAEDPVKQCAGLVWLWNLGEQLQDPLFQNHVMDTLLEDMDSLIAATRKGSGFVAAVSRSWVESYGSARLRVLLTDIIADHLTREQLKEYEIDELATGNGNKTPDKLTRGDLYDILVRKLQTPEFRQREDALGNCKYHVLPRGVC
jgi:hypothetical protein